MERSSRTPLTTDSNPLPYGRYLADFLHHHRRGLQHDA